MSSPYLVMESTPTLSCRAPYPVMSSVVETSLQGDREISPCAALSRDDIGKWKLSRDDSGMDFRNREAMDGGCPCRRG